MQLPIVRSVNGYLCLTPAEVPVARRGIDPAQGDNQRNAASAPPATQTASGRVDRRI